MQRQVEVYASGRTERLTVLRRDDGRFMLLKELLRSYENGDEYNPAIVPFPLSGALPECSMVHETLLDGLFGSAIDAEAEARRWLGGH